MHAFTLRWLLLFVAAICVSVAAVTNPNEWWGAGFGAAIIALLCYGFTRIFIGGPHRGYWIGLLGFMIVNGVLLQFPPRWLTNPLVMLPELLVRYSLGPAPLQPQTSQYSVQQIHPSPQAQQQYHLAMGQRNMKQQELEQTVIGLMLLWIGALGGWVGQRIALRKEQP